MPRWIAVTALFLVAVPTSALAQSVPPLDRGAGTCIECAPDGWLVSQPSPDVIIGNGVWPGGGWVVSDVAGGPVEGTTMPLLLSGAAIREGISTTITGLTPGQVYTVSVHYQGATLSYPGQGTHKNGSFSVTVAGVTTTFPTADGDAWTAANGAPFTASGTTETVTLAIASLGDGSFGGAVVADGISVALDSDGDTDPDETDCEPDDETIFNGAPDAECDGVDNNCDGTPDDEFVLTVTSCGVGPCSAMGMTSCVDGSVVDSCVPGTPAPTDETCDGVDDDCSGDADEDYVALVTNCGVGACEASGTTSCADGEVVDSCVPGAPASSDETCDGIDDDCSGTADEDYVPVATTCWVGPCRASGVTSCTDDGAVSDSCTPGAPDDTEETCEGDWLCGDGARFEGEECEDGNNDDGDGCSAQCRLELGWSCIDYAVGVIQSCEPVAEDGVVVGSEECDDGNAAPGDGCTDGAIDDGWFCDDGEPSVCSEVDACGHGARDAGEDCDAGDADSDIDGDGLLNGDDPSPTEDAESPDQGCGCGVVGGSGGSFGLAGLALVVVGLVRRRDCRR